jgi:hypothetical protein
MYVIATCHPYGPLPDNELISMAVFDPVSKDARHRVSTMQPDRPDRSAATIRAVRDLTGSTDLSGSTRQKNSQKKYSP